jgi:hypothetical protein
VNVPGVQRIRFNRQLHIKGPDTPRGEGEIFFEVFNNGSEWQCEYELSGALCEARNFLRPNGRSLGEDGLQAVQLCLRHLHFLITEFEKCGGSVWWLNEGDRGQLIDKPPTLD